MRDQVGLLDLKVRRNRVRSDSNFEIVRRFTKLLVKN